MRKTVSPTVAMVVVIIVLVVVGYFFWQRVKGPRKVIMTPQGAVDADTGRLLTPRGDRGQRGGRRGGGGAGGEQTRQGRRAGR